MSDQSARQKLTLSIDFKWLSIILAVALIGLTIYTRPWQGNTAASQRKITISGEATIKAEPDEYVFNPMWERATIDELTALNDQIVVKLKELGVADSAIKNNASAWQDYRVASPAIETQPGAPEPAPTTTVRQLSITITLNNKELSQKVQDYLVTTNPLGAITPYAQFSTDKQKSLEDQARGDAIADAKKRAQTTAAGLDAEIGDVIEVSESAGGSMPWIYSTKAADAATSSSGASLSLQPGENEFTYTVQVIFELQ